MGDREIREWVERSGYGASLGVELVSLGEERATLRLPYKDQNSNPGRALHGGCAASLGAIGAQAVARAALGVEAGPFHTAEMQIAYLSAAIGEDVVAEARLLRRGKEICFAEVDVASADGRPIAHASSVVRARFGAPAAPRLAAAGDDGAADPGPMGPHIGAMPFTRARGLVVEHMTGARSRIVMPWSESNADREGGVHEGALIALFDTTGAMAAWAETGPGRYKASTPALQIQFLAPPPPRDLVAYGRLVQRDADVFWCDVEVAASSGEEAGAVVARGTVLYRIVT